MLSHPAGDNLTTAPSISTVMTEGDLVPPTKPAGLGWWRTIFSRVGPPVACPKLQRVRFISTSPFDEAIAIESSF